MAQLFSQCNKFATLCVQKIFYDFYLTKMCQDKKINFVEKKWTFSPTSFIVMCNTFFRWSQSMYFKREGARTALILNCISGILVQCLAKLKTVHFQFCVSWHKIGHKIWNSCGEKKGKITLWIKCYLLIELHLFDFCQNSIELHSLDLCQVKFMQEGFCKWNKTHCNLLHLSAC